LPIGAIMSMMRPVMSSVEPLPRSSLSCSRGKFRGQVFKQDLVLGGFRAVVVEFFDLEQREIAFGLLGRANLAGDVVAGAQVEAADLRGRDVDIVRAGHVRGLRGTQETEAVLQDLQNPVTVDGVLVFGLGLENREDDVLLARAADVFDAEFLGHFNQLRGGFCFEFCQVHGGVFLMGCTREHHGQTESSPIRHPESGLKSR
jgi:hypothetical protein